MNRPSYEVQLEVSGHCRGEWDDRRLRQLLANLTLNAIKYGAGDKPVNVAVVGLSDDVHIEVRTKDQRSTERRWLTCSSP